MTEIVIEERNGDEDEIARYKASVSPRVNEVVSILNKGAAHYTKYLVVKVEHAIYHGKAMVVCYVNPA